MKDIDLIKEKYNIKDLLDCAGITYKVDKNGDLLVKSPANLEQKTESLRIRANYRGNYNYFKDFLTEKYGDILNFAEYYFNLDTKQAVNLLKDTFGNERNLDILNEIKEKNRIFIEEMKKKIEKENKTIEIENIRELKNTALIDYLQSRKIDLATANAAGIKELYYINKNNNKHYFGLCFENESGGFEVRNKFFKGSFGKKDITVKKNSSSKEVNIFEGFLDYASSIVISKGKVLAQNNIILNSVAEKNRAVETILGMDINTVKLYLDNDEAGKKTAAFFKAELSKKGIKVEDRSVYYANFDDLNDYLTGKEKEKEFEDER